MEPMPVRTVRDHLRLQSSSDTVLVSSTEFDMAGRVYKTTDPAGAVVKNEYDDAGKTTKVIHNFGGTDTQTIRTEYNTSGQMSKQIAENSDTGNQETSYTYGVTTAFGLSDLASNQLLSQMTYPDSGTVTYDYDRTGQQTSMTDPNGTVHEYEYDDAGRRIEDRVATVGSGVDATVRRIEHTYDNRLRLEKITLLRCHNDGECRIPNPVCLQRFWTSYQGIPAAWGCG